MARRSVAFAAAGAVAMVVLGVNVALARNWVNSSSYPTIMTATDYYTAANWADETPPTDEESGNFHACPAGKWTFIKSDRMVDTRSILTCDSSTYGDARSVSIVSDAGFTILGSGSSTGLWIGPTLYGDVASSLRLVTWSANLCGDFQTTADANNAQGQVTLSAGTFRYRSDRYANSANPVRVNPMQVQHFYIGAGDWAIHSPASAAEDVTGRWNQTENSPYLTPSSGTSHVLPVGTVVRGDGVTEGTFLRRVFPDGSIELSKPIESGKTLSDNELTFSAFSPKVSISCKQLSISAAEQRSIFLNCSGEASELEMEIGSLNGISGERKLYFGAESGYRAGTLKILDGSLYSGRISLGNVKLTAVSNTFANIVFTQPMAAATTTVEVEAPSKTIRLGKSLSAVAGTFVKSGAGTLQIRMDEESAATGRIDVMGGTLEVLFDSNGVEKCDVGTLMIAENGSLKLGGGELRVGSLAAETGARITGEGVLTVPAGTDVSKIEVTGNVAIHLEGAKAVVNWSLPATNVPGNPALWIDASREDSITFGANGTDVLRIDDVRGGSYFFASNVASQAASIPQYSRNAILRKLPYIALKSSGTTLATCGALYWDRPISGIRAVFFVQEISNATSDLLGKSDRLGGGYGDFALPGGMKWNNEWGVGMVWGQSPSANVLNAPFYQDGEPCKATSRYHAPITCTSGGTTYVIPTVTEAHPIGTGAKADCFGWDSGTQSCGGQRICECIVYTNELTETERLEVLGYLSKKWRQAEPEWEQYPPASGNLGVVSSESMPCVAVGANETVSISSVTGTGDFAKTGEGVLSVGEFVHPDGVLSVVGGRMTLASGLDEDVFPEGAYLHVDASKTNTVTYSETSGGELRVSKWRDARTDSDMGTQVYSGQTVYPVLKPVAALGGKHVVDLGQSITTYSLPGYEGQYVNAASIGKASALKFTKNGTDTSIDRGLKTGFWILGSENGGGSLIGSGGNDFTTGYGIQRNGSGGSVASALLRTSDDYKVTSYPSWFNSTLRDVRVNGIQTDVAAANPFSGGYDLVTFSVHAPFGGVCFGLNHYGFWSGGQSLGEVALFREKLASNTIDRVEAYLRAKWFGLETPGFRAACAKALSIAVGATLEVKGGPLAVSSVSGGGTVVGSLALAADAVIEVPVSEDGSVGTVSVTGDIDLSKGGTVRLIGFPKKLAPGVHILIASPSISAGRADAWTVENPSRNRVVVVRFVDGALQIEVSKKGLAIVVR